MTRSVRLATPDVIHQAQFALDVKAAVLPLYEKVFDVEYPLPKLDTLVVSTDQQSCIILRISDITGQRFRRRRNGELGSHYWQNYRIPPRPQTRGPVC